MCVLYVYVVMLVWHVHLPSITQRYVERVVKCNAKQKRYVLSVLFYLSRDFCFLSSLVSGLFMSLSLPAKPGGRQPAAAGGQLRSEHYNYVAILRVYQTCEFFFYYTVVLLHCPPTSLCDKGAREREREKERKRESVCVRLCVSNPLFTLTISRGEEKK